MAALLEERLGVRATLLEGGTGELSVWAGDRLLARRNWLGFLPIERSLVAAVERALTAQR